MSRTAPARCAACARRLQPAPARPRTVRASEPPVEPIPGQTELPLTHFQPTLESL